MRAYDCAFLVRRVLEHLQMDESLPFFFRVDHKLVQSVLLQYFAPSASLRIMGLAEAMKHSGHNSVPDYLQELFPNGFVVKDAYGYNSGRNTVLESAGTVQERIEYAASHYYGSADTELWFAQERFCAVREYRVHTLGKDVIPSLTYRTYGSVSKLGEIERDAVGSFVNSVIISLPSPLIAASLCGWDIGVDSTGNFKIFEINYTGLHPFHEPGFHCTAYLQGYIDASLNQARLIHFVQQRYNVTFEIVVSPTNNPVETDAASFLYQVKGWLQLMTITDTIDSLWQSSYKDAHSFNCVHGVIEPLRGVIFANAAGPTERRYCEYLDWLRKLTEGLCG